MLRRHWLYAAVLCIVLPWASVRADTTIEPAEGGKVDKTLKKYEDATESTTGVELDPATRAQIEQLQQTGYVPPEASGVLQDLLDGEMPAQQGVQRQEQAAEGVDYFHGVDLDKNRKQSMGRKLAPEKPRLKKMDSGFSVPKGDFQPVDFGKGLNEKGLDYKPTKRSRGMKGLSGGAGTGAGGAGGGAGRGKGFSPGGGMGGGGGGGGGPPGVQSGAFHPMQFRGVTTPHDEGGQALRSVQPWTEDGEGEDGSGKDGRSWKSGQYGELREKPASARDMRKLVTSEREKYRKRAESASSDLEKDPEDSGAYNELARSQIAQGQYSEAVQTARKAIDTSARNPAAHVLRAIANEQLGNDGAKMQDLGIAAAQDPVRFNEHLQKARAGERLFDPTDEDSWFLLEALVEPRGRSSGGLPSWMTDAFLFLLTIVLLGIIAALAVRFYRGLSQASQQQVASQLRRAVKGQVLPKVDKGAPAGTSASADGPICENAVLAGKYKLLKVTGMDGAAQVWKAQDRTLGRKVIIKRFFAAPTSDEERARVLAEAKRAASLHHPNIAELFEILDRPSGLYLVYEYAPGKSIRRILEDVGTLPVRQILGVLIPVCRALEHARHHDIPHGGLSPERIVLTQQGYIKVTDFVLARTTAPTAKPYAAPELDGDEPTTVSDIFSMGTCFVEMLTGKPPPYAELISLKLEAGVEEIIMKAMDPDPETRLDSPVSLLEALQRLADGEGGLA